MTDFDTLVADAGAVLTLTERFPTSYNRLMVRGWTDYARLALLRKKLPDPSLYALAGELFRHALSVLGDYVGRPEALRYADGKLVELASKRLEERAVALKILPKLEDVAVADTREAGR